MSLPAIPIQSIPPNVVKEATRTRFQISLLLFVVCTYGAYWLGSQSAKAQVEQMKEQSIENRKACAEHVASLKEQNAIVLKSNEQISQNILATQDRMMTLSNEVVELNSKLGKGK